MRIDENRVFCAKGVDGTEEHDAVLSRDGVMPDNLILYHGGCDGCSDPFRKPVGEVVHAAQVLVGFDHTLGTDVLIPYAEYVNHLPSLRKVVAIFEDPHQIAYGEELKRPLPAYNGNRTC